MSATLSSELFVGITSWNSALFLPHCIRSILATVPGDRVRIVVLDNSSTDGSADIARDCGAEVSVESCCQGDALNRLVELSRSAYMLLLHADVVMLSDRWFQLCVGKLGGGIGLVSPEDIGCGPLTRPFGRGKPESSFLFFATRELKKLRVLRWHKWRRIPIPRREVDFYGEHVTHKLPGTLKETGSGWYSMTVHVSVSTEAPIYRPNFAGSMLWNEELAHLRYGLGNFYSIDGTITHYHNWYDRIERGPGAESGLATAREGGFPTAYIRAYTEAFLRDHKAGCLALPEPAKTGREPVAMQTAVFR